MDYQFMPDLTPEEYEALKADIAERGVLVPIELDDEGNVLDGHHRLRACEELGITDYPTITRMGMTEDEKVVHAVTLNTVRRHMTREQKRQAIQRMLERCPNLSDREIARAVGSTHPTVGKYRRQLEGGERVVKLTIEERPETFTCCICGREVHSWYSNRWGGEPIDVNAYDPWPVMKEGDCCFECSQSISGVVKRMPEEARNRHYLGPHWRTLLEVAQTMRDDGLDHITSDAYDPVEYVEEFERRLRERGITDTRH